MKQRVLAGVPPCATLGCMAVLMLIAAWQEPKTPDIGPQLGSAFQASLAHFALFGILGTLVGLSVYYLKGRQQALLALAAASLVGLIWGAATESYQLNVPGREFSMLDILVNLLGAGFGGFVVVGLLRVIRFPVYRS